MKPYTKQIHFLAVYQKTSGIMVMENFCHILETCFFLQIDFLLPSFGRSAFSNGFVSIIIFTTGWCRSSTNVTISLIFGSCTFRSSFHHLLRSLPFFSVSTITSLFILSTSLTRSITWSSAFTVLFVFIFILVSTTTFFTISRTTSALVPIN